MVKKSQSQIPVESVFCSETGMSPRSDFFCDGRDEIPYKPPREEEKCI